MRERLGRGTALRVGLAWAGNPENAGDGRRSIPLAKFCGLRDVPGVEWVSLHHDRHDDVCGQGGWVREVLSKDGGLAELAALMSCLDLIISVDTMAVHLAGAMGRPVWNLLCATADWRWGRIECVTPWYPSMRLYRQPKPGDWTPVMDRVAADLIHRRIQGFSGPTDTEK
jgi:hypothetical protein